MKLDKERVLQLLAEADRKWFKDHTGKFNYREHLDFVAGHVANKYHRGGSRAKAKGTVDR